MPGSEHHSLEQLNYAALQNFIDTDVGGFLHRIDDLRSPDAHPKSLFDVSTMPQVLAIGPMASDDQTGGKGICDNAKKAAGAIDNVLSRHKTAFTKLQADLENVIKSFKDSQAKNLTDVKTADFMKSIGDYTAALGGGGTSTGSGTGTGNSQSSTGL